MEPEAFKQGAWGAQLRKMFEDARALIGGRPVPGGPVFPGDLFVFKSPVGAETLVHWLVVSRNPNDESFLIIPLDDRLQAGTADQEIPHDLTPWPMVARCAQAIWVSRPVVATGTRVGHLGDGVIFLVRKKFVELVSGKLLYTETQIENDSDPELDEWMVLIEAARSALEMAEESAMA